MDWHQQVEVVTPHVTKITTPETSGTGFLVLRKGNRFGVATAAHVVSDAIALQRNITIHHDAFETPLTLGESARITLIHPDIDSAYIEGELPSDIKGSFFPEKPVEAVPLGTSVKPGVQVGWLGFPYMVPNEEPCFFSGHISAYISGSGRYFIDGVAIPGVSGGPAFLCHREKPLVVRILGSITSYAPARSGQESIPGLMVADMCSHWHKFFGEKS